VDGKSKNRKIFGIERKLFGIFFLVLVFTAGIVFTTFYGLYRIGEVSKIVTERETPLVRSTEEALSAMVIGLSAVEQALDVSSKEDLVRVGDLELKFSNSVARFNTFMAAITWGSETEAFRRSAGGENYRTWVNLGLQGNLVVLESPGAQVQLAGQAALYYEGFVNNARDAINLRKEFLLSSGVSAGTTTEALRNSSRETAGKARRFADLATENLRSMVELSNKTTQESALALARAERNAFTMTLVISIIGLLAIAFVSTIVTRRVVVRPLSILSDAASALGEGKLSTRVDIKTGDEMEVLGATFNTMAEHLFTYTTGLEGEVAKRTQELKENVVQLNIKNEMLTTREEELTIANNRLRELDRAKSEFISVAAHQLRTPLSAVKWIISILTDENSENLSTEQRTLLLKGYESNERMINLVNEMLEVTRIESGKVVFKPVPIHLEDLVDNILIDFTGQAYVRKIKVEFDHPKARLPSVLVDPDKTRSVLQNLIENAVKYTPDGGAIRATLATDGNVLRFSVSDSGIGIPESQQNAIFSKFFRADNAVKREADGSGLGLFIAKSIVERQGGQIWFESKEDAGTTFYFTVPIPKTNTA